MKPESEVIRDFLSHIIMKPVKVLCIGGSDSSGGAGIQADLKAVSACGCWGMNVITVVTAQNTRGVQDIFAVPAEFVKKQMDIVLSDIGADAVKTGMLLTAAVAFAVAEKIKQYKIGKLIVDPVMVAKGGRNLLLAEARQAMLKKMLPLALVVTPNIPEAEELAQMEIKTIADVKKAAKIIYEFGVQNVLIKGGHLTNSKNKDTIDILFDGKKYFEFSAPRIDSHDTHGTGCTYASALACGLAAGKDVSSAAAVAKELVSTAIKNSVSLGAGHGSVNVLKSLIKSKRMVK
jgi:hydroxymethylpyrimidine kinase/phosphomethylpyrimidine kinase